MRKIKVFQNIIFIVTNQKSYWTKKKKEKRKKKVKNIENNLPDLIFLAWPHFSISNFWSLIGICLLSWASGMHISCNRSGQLISCKKKKKKRWLRKIKLEEFIFFYFLILLNKFLEAHVQLCYKYKFFFFFLGFKF